jgi:hypothetical protein
VARRIVGRPNQFRFSSFSLSGALCKLANLPFLNSKNYQTFWGGKKKWNNFTLGHNFKFQMDFEVQIQEFNTS